MFGNLQALSQQPTQQQTQPQSAGLFGQPSTSAPALSTTGLLPQQTSTVPQFNLLQQQPQIATQAPAAPVAQPRPQEEDTQVLRDWKDKNIKMVFRLTYYFKKTQEENLRDLHTKMQLLNNRVQRNFTKKYVLPCSSEQMNSEVSKILTDNLSRMGVSINHIYYINDMLKGLNDKIRADKENVDNGFLYLIRD